MFSVIVSTGVDTSAVPWVDVGDNMSSASVTSVDIVTAPTGSGVVAKLVVSGKFAVFCAGRDCVIKAGVGVLIFSTLPKAGDFVRRSVDTNCDMSLVNVDVSMSFAN